MSRFLRFACGLACVLGFAWIVGGPRGVEIAGAILLLFAGGGLLLEAAYPPRPRCLREHVRRGHVQVPRDLAGPFTAQP